VEKLRGYTVAEAMAQSVEESFAPESARLVQTKLSEIAAKKSTNQTIDRETFELEQPCKTGSKVWIEVTTTPLFNENGDLVGIQGASRDITERRRAQQAEKDQRTLAEALRDSAAALNKAFNLDEVYDALIVDIGRVVPHDSVHILMTGLDGITQIVRSSGFETVIENAALHLSAVLLNAAETENLKQMTITGNACRIADIRNYPWVETGLTGWAHSCLGAPIFIKNRVMGFIILLCKSENFFSEQHGDHLMAFSDQAAIAIEKAQLIAQLNQMATQDSLTQIFNRRAFFEKGDLEFERSIRYQHPLTTLMLDIDHFKMVNDTYGHSTGDQVLQGVSQICAQSIRKIDVLGRYGGEEFAIVFPEITDEKALEAAERIRLNIAQTPIATDRGPVQVTVSIGLAEYHPEIGSFRSLLDQADEALYQAKLAGRNQVKRLK
jgi:diguanylate cyclase (GGDEF)-like protein/PAS domain S-box-containing protein